MSRKHPHRAGNQPVTRRYVAGVVRRARDEIISAIIYRPELSAPEWKYVEPKSWSIMVEPSPERLKRAVDG